MSKASHATHAGGLLAALALSWWGTACDGNEEVREKAAAPMSLPSV